MKDGVIATQTLEVPKNPILGGPAFVFEFLSIGAAKMHVGESREIDFVSFGFPGWELSVAKMTMKREADTEQIIGKRTFKTQHYNYDLAIPIGRVTSDVWAMDNGLSLRSVTRLPFGTMSYELDVESLVLPDEQ